MHHACALLYRIQLLIYGLHRFIVVENFNLKCIKIHISIMVSFMLNYRSVKDMS